MVRKMENLAKPARLRPIYLQNYIWPFYIQIWQLQKLSRYYLLLNQRGKNGIYNDTYEKSDDFD